MTEPLSGRDLDIAVHRALGFPLTHDPEIVDAMRGIMRCKRCKERWGVHGGIEGDCIVPPYSTDDNLRRLILASVVERKLEREFSVALCAEVDCDVQGLGFVGAWYGANASMDQLCRVFVGVVGEKQS